jgi:hypothetical protein
MGLRVERYGTTAVYLRCDGYRSISLKMAAKSITLDRVRSSGLQRNCDRFRTRGVQLPATITLQTGCAARSVDPLWDFSSELGEADRDAGDPPRRFSVLWHLGQSGKVSGGAEAR